MRKTVCSPKLEALESRQLLSAAKPTFNAWAISPTQVEVSWSPVKNSTGYLVQELVQQYKIEKIHGRKVSVPVMGWETIAQVGSGATSYVVNGLTPSTVYQIDLASLRGRTQNQAVEQLVTTLCSIPQWSAVNTTTTQTTLQWGSVPGATNYLAYQYTSAGWSEIGGYGSNVTAATIYGLSPNTSYGFDVVACNSAGATWGNAQVVTTLIAAPNAPQWSSTVTTNQITLNWSSVLNAANYTVYLYSGGSWQAIADLGSNVTSYTIGGLQPNTGYYLDVVASNSTGATWGNAQVVTTSIGAPNAPQWSSTVTTNSNHPTIDNPIVDSRIDSNSQYTAAPNPTLLWGANGPQYTDVQQGGEGDCWLLSAYAAIAAHSPSLIENMFQYLGTWNLSDGAVAFYNVTFYSDSGVAHTVVVDTELPTGPYAGGYACDQPVNGVLWAALLEKGYAEANGHGWVDTEVANSDSYAALNSGYPAWALTTVTDHSANNVAVNSNTIAADLQGGNAIVCIWTTNPTNSEIVGDHSYGIVGYNANSTMPFTIYNPWGANANYSNVYETFTANGPFIDTQFSYMSICII